MIDLGADELVEIGPGTTLTALSSRISPDLTTRNVAVPADLSIGVEVHA
jgi:hypothetical protein